MELCVYFVWLFLFAAFPQAGNHVADAGDMVTVWHSQGRGYMSTDVY
jgi:hypothetical protein